MPARSNKSARLFDAGTQENALQKMHEVAQRAAIHPDTVTVAKQITHECESREDLCEVSAIFEAVKSGNANVPAFHNGMKYMRDPRFADYFTSPVDMLRNCTQDACAGDCDDHAMMIVALLAALGWKVGLRAYGTERNAYSHVYAVVAFPKIPIQQGERLVWTRVLGLDTTVPRSSVGWEPPRANVLTSWLE